MSKQYSEGEDLQKKIVNGVNILANNVASTLGPRGRNVVLHKKGSNPVITKDGVTVANFVDLDDPFENIGAQVVKQVASETNNVAGDGTTTSTVLAQALLNNALKYIAAGISPVELKRGMDKAADEVVRRVKAASRAVETEEDIKHIATVSANGDISIGEMISMAVDKAGHNGSISIEEAKSMDTSLDLIEGFSFQSGYFSSSFITNEKKHAIEYDNALLFVTDYKIDNVTEILPVLELAAREARPLVIIAEEVEGQALAAMIMNATRGTMKVAAVKAPGYGNERRSIMKDLCVSTGATFFTRESGKKMAQVKLVDFGECKKIEVLKNSTIIVGGLGDVEMVDKRIESLKEEIKQTEDMRECELIQDRITRLISGVVVINVGGSTEVEMLEKKHRIEDALEAVHSALDSGIVPGGGATLARLSSVDVQVDSKEQEYGAEIVKKSLAAPLRQMACNANLSADIIIDKILQEEEEYGWDFANNELTNMFDEGIIDPSKVTITALKNAVSAISTLITTGHAIVEK